MLSVWIVAWVTVALGDRGRKGGKEKEGGRGMDGIESSERVGGREGEKKERERVCVGKGGRKEVGVYVKKSYIRGRQGYYICDRGEEGDACTEHKACRGIHT